MSGLFNEGDSSLRSLGIQCALCHSTVDNSFAPGIGQRLDGWPNRDLNVGAIVNLSPDLSVVANLLGVDQATVRTVLQSWGPGNAGRFPTLLEVVNHYNDKGVGNDSVNLGLTAPEKADLVEYLKSL